YRIPGFGPNWVVFILPFIEQDNLFKSVDVKLYMLSGGADQSWRKLAVATIPIMLCPSDPNNSTNFTLNTGQLNAFWARGNYAANAGAGWYNWTTDLHSHDGGSTGGGTTDNCGGAMGVNCGATLTQISSKDGTANTIMLNEIRAGLVSVDRRGVWAMGLGGSSITAACAIGDATQPNDANEYSDDIEDCNAVRQALGVGNSGPGPNRMGCHTANLPKN